MKKSMQTSSKNRKLGASGPAAASSRPATGSVGNSSASSNNRHVSTNRTLTSDSDVNGRP